MMLISPSICIFVFVSFVAALLPSPICHRKISSQPQFHDYKKSLLYASITSTTTTKEDTSERMITDNADSDDQELCDTNPKNEIATNILTHIQNAKQSTNDISGEMECAERALIEWVEQCRDRKCSLPDDTIFGNVIEGLLALPSSFEFIIGSDEDAKKMNDEIRRSILDIGKASKQTTNLENSRTQRATQILDLMESFHEPPGALYDTLIASHGEDALQCLSHMNREKDKEQQDEDDESKDYSSSYYYQAWKSGKASLKLLQRSEELYYETGQAPIQLPSVSSYIIMMDVWKALAMGVEQLDQKNKRDEALEVVRNLRQRRLKIYTAPTDDIDNIHQNSDGGDYNILPHETNTMTAEQVLNYAANLLSDSVPSYQLRIKDPKNIGTWHYNQLMFDLARLKQPFSGPLAQDLLEYMVYLVKKASPLSQQHRRHQKNRLSPMPRLTIPKPNVDTINAVLKAWMVTPNNSDIARRAEAVLAKLAVWQSEGTLWGVNPDTVSYNTVINIWKNSGVTGAAQRATEILQLFEDESTAINPDVISYSTTIGAWAKASSRDPIAGQRAEEILMRMYNRYKDANGNEIVAPRPSTRIFNSVFLAYANGGQSGGGKRSLELLRFMERLNSEGFIDMSGGAVEPGDLSPDKFTFNIVMRALSNCGEKGASRKANQLLERMVDSFNKGNTKLKPDLLSYNTVLDAFSKEGDARSAERLLNQMLASEDCQPDSYSFTSVLTAWSRSNGDKVEAVRRAEDLFNIEIEARYAAGKSDFHSDTSVYNALINVWAKSGERKAIYRVTQILNLMENLGYEGGDSNVQPDSFTYTAVLDTLARSKNYKAYDMSLEILERMQNYYVEGYSSVRPCTRAYSIVLSTIARSRRTNKARKAQDLLHQMESEYRGGNQSCRPNVISYNAVLNAAAFSGRDEQEQEEAFKVACLTFEELRMSDYLQPSHISYGTFLKAIKNLMPESDVRDSLVQGLFRRACREGLVSDFVLKEMGDLAGENPGLYQTLLQGYTSDYGILPEHWSENVGSIM